MPAGLVSRSHGRALAIALALLFVPLLLPLFTGRVLTLDDLGAFHLPLRFLYRQSLQNGDSLLWSPALFSGFYVFGEGQVGEAHPFHWLLYRVLDLPAAFDLEILANYVALFTGTCLLLRRFGISRDAAWFGGGFFTFSGSALLHLVHVNAVAVAAHLPWLLLTSDVLLTSVRSRARALAFAATAVLIASELLLGHPQYVWITSLAVVYLACCRLATGARALDVALLTVAAALGALTGAVQLIPTLDALGQSFHAAPPPAFQFSFSLEPRHLLFLLSPNLFRVEYLQEFSIYTGAFGTLALAWIALRWRHVPHGGLTRALLVLALIGLLLALGPFGGIYPWLARLPGVSSFRAPARHLLLFHLALSGLAAIAFEDLAALSRRGERIAWRRLWLLAIPAWLSVAITVNAAVRADVFHESQWLSLFASQPLRANLSHAWPWTCLAIVLTLLLMLAARAHRQALPLLVIGAALDQGLWGYSFVYGLAGEHFQTVEALVATAPAPPQARAGDLVFDNTSNGEIGNLNVLRGLRRSTGYVALPPSSALDPANPVAQRLAGVRWRLAGGAWLPVADAMPRARLVSSVRRSTNFKADLASIDISSVALVDADIGTLSGAPGSARVAVDRPGRIDIETIAPGEQLLIVTERYHQGWQATVDGRATPVQRAFGTYLACVVGPGTRRVSLTFAPASLRAGAIASGIGLTLTLIATVLLLRRRDGDRPSVVGQPRQQLENDGPS